MKIFVLKQESIRPLKHGKWEFPYRGKSMGKYVRFHIIGRFSELMRTQPVPNFCECMSSRSLETICKNSHHSQTMGFWKNVKLKRNSNKTYSIAAVAKVNSILWEFDRNTTIFHFCRLGLCIGWLKKFILIPIMEN